MAAARPANHGNRRRIERALDTTDLSHDLINFSDAYVPTLVSLLDLTALTKLSAGNARGHFRR